MAKKQGKDIDKLFQTVDILVNDEKLETKYKEHYLTGNYKEFKECEPDWLLIYKFYDDIMVLFLSRLGSHSELL